MYDVINPYIVGSPIKSAGSEMFFGREDIIDSVCQTILGQHGDRVVVLYGQRRTGKTSVLYQIPSRLESRYLCIMVDMHQFACEGISGLLWELANHIVHRLRHDHQVSLPPPIHSNFMDNARSYFENEFLDQVSSAIGTRRILLMLDEVGYLQERIQAGKLEADVFEYLRHLMQHCEQLNFLFSLSSSLEELKKEYTFLFSIALHKKISFLDNRAVTTLITQPVRDYYHVESTAVDHIIHITSGHPYYTQLLCYCIFQRWQEQRTSPIKTQDVDAILDDAVELGLPVLKYVWEDSKPGEKAIMAAMVAAMHDQKGLVGDSDVSQVWKRLNVTMPKGERAEAIQKLIMREIIESQDKYRFTVNLQRLWVQKYRQLAWVKEEIASTVQEWSRESNRLLRRRLLTDSTILLGLLVAGGVAYQRIFAYRAPSNLLYTYHGHTDKVVGVAWSPDGTRIASGSWDTSVQVWDALTGKHLYIYRGHTKRVTCVAWSPDGTRIASGSDDHTVQVWNAVNGIMLYTYRGHTGDVHSLAWSPDGTRIASSSNDETVQIWQAQDGSQVLLHHDPSYVWSAAWSPDGTRIASGSSDNFVRVWDAKTDQVLVTFPHTHSSLVRSVAWSPDGTRIASGSDDNSTQLWDIVHNQSLRTFTDHSDKVWAVAWSPDGKRLASGSLDRTVMVRDTRNGGLLLTYRGHADGVGAVAWSHDGTRIASGSYDQTVQVWKV